MSERRLTMHNGRQHKGGKTFSSKHNDHKQENGHWDKEKASENWLWKSKVAQGDTFDEGEKAFYEKYFRKTLDAQNERHKKSRHLERIKTMDEFRASKHWCPEETLFYLGDKDNQVKKETFLEVIKVFFNWHQETFPQCKILNIAFHGDEPGADHVHMRKVWMAKDENGEWIVNQNKSLEQMGVKLPNEEFPICSTNNRKMTYTEICREKFFDIAKERGVEFVTEPRPKEEQGMSMSEYLEKKAEKKERELEDLVKDLKTANEKDGVEFATQKAIVDDLRRDLIKSANKEFEGDLGAKLKATSIIRECIQRALEKLGLIKKRVDDRTKEIQKVEPTYKMELEMPEEEEMER